MIDDLDKKIIRAMNQNARRSYREIAKDVGTSASVVIHAVKKMESLGAIRGYIPVIDAGHFGFDLMAIIALRISQGKLLDTQKKIALIAQVAGVYDVTGEWDSLILAYFKGREDLNDFLKKLNAMRYIDRTVTHVVLNVVKDERRIFV